MRKREIDFSLFIAPENMGVIINEGFDFLVDIVQRAEKLGFKAFFVPDHYMYSKNNILYEALTVLGAIASRTRTIRIGTCVTPIPFYNPGVLAKRIASLDHISKGRVIFGVGCGWYEKEFESYGIPFDPFRERIRRMIEGVELIKALWTTEGPVNYDGKYYSLKGAELLPKPTTKPHPQMWFGGASTPILKAVAKHGQGWIPGAESPVTYKKKSDSLALFAQKQRRESSEITLALALRTIVASTSQEVRRILRMLSLTKEEEGRMFSGTPREIITKIRDYANAGVSHFRLGIQPAYRITESLELYSEEIIPEI